MSSGNELRESIRDDERRRRDEVRVATLQSQVDEMRSAFREVVHRQARSEEQFKHYEAGLAELRVIMDHHRHEVAQSSQARQLEDTRIREQLSELDARIDELNRPIRALQSHVAEALEAIRRGRDDDQEEARRFEELKSMIENVASMAERNGDAIRSLRDSVEDVRGAHSQTAREVVRLDDAIRIVEQDSRRRDSELEQQDETVEARLTDMAPIFDQHQAQIDDLRDATKHIDPTLDQLRRTDEQLREEVVRLAEQSRERDEIQGERIDEIRVQLDASIRDVRQTIGENHERVNDRIDDQADRIRDQVYAQAKSDMRIDELEDADLRIRREVWHLHEMRTRQRLDQIQEELEAVVQNRREADLDAEREPRQGRDSQSSGQDDDA
jgi:chromosome segregation ATPase